MKIETIKNTSVKISIEETKVIGDKTIVILIPGVSGKVFTDKYKEFVDTCTDNGLSVARMQSWESTDDLQKKSLADLHKDLDTAVAYLRELGYETIYAVGKSLGGGILLTRNHPDIKKLVLWAPAISASKSEGNLAKMKDKKLGDIQSLVDIKMGKTFLSGEFANILIIHGTDDTHIPIANSKRIVSLLNSAELYPIDKMDHSYDKYGISEMDEKMRETDNKTVQFLIKQ